jgi:hypothetical protein
MPRPLGLSELEGVVRDSKPDALVMLPAAYVLDLIEHVDELTEYFAWAEPRGAGWPLARLWRWLSGQA